MPSIREAIEARLAKYDSDVGGSDRAALAIQFTGDVRAILSAPEPSREELREKVKAAIMPLVVDYGADMGDQTNEDMANEYTDRILALLHEDLADATLPDMPTSKRTVVLYEEPLREKLKDAAINKALDRIAFLTDSGDYHGYRSEMWSAVAEVFDAALSRESAPAKPIEDRSHEIEFTDDEDRTPEQIALMADLTAKPAEPTLGFIHDADEYFGKELKVYPTPAKGAEPKCICIRANIGGGFIHLRGCPIHGDKANPGKWAPEPPAPQSVTTTQPTTARRCWMPREPTVN
jgi:hypothetical protein